MTINVPLIRRATFSNCIDTLEGINGSPEKLLKRNGLRQWHHGDGADLVPLHDATALLQLGAKATGDRMFGWQVAKEHNFKTHGALGQIILSSVSIFDALRNFCYAISLYASSSAYWIEDGDTVVWMCRKQPDGMIDTLWQMELYTLGYFVSVVRLGVGQSWRPKEVRLINPDAKHLLDSNLLADCQVQPGQEYTALAIPKDILFYSIGHMSGRRNEIAHEHAASKAILGSQAPAVGLAGSIRELVLSILSEGVPDIEIMSDVLSVPSRTLQRALASEGKNYRDIVGQARMLRAAKLLSTTDWSPQEIAHELEYQNASTFGRAFRKWAGVSPSEFRICSSS